MNDLAGLQALVEDVGSGNVIDAELLDGCPVEAHELDEMDASQAAQVAAPVSYTHLTLPTKA
mgnify:CR=1 FL=1